MSAAAALIHKVNAFNLSAASENKIHDDAVAQNSAFKAAWSRASRSTPI